MLLLFSADAFCKSTASIWAVIGWVVFVLRIAIPLLLIIYGMLDLGKAVIAAEDKAINKAVNTLIHRFIAALAVFFIPPIVLGIFNAVTGFNDVSETGGAKRCAKCVLDVAGASSLENGSYCKSSNAISTTNIVDSE